MLDNEEGKHIAAALGNKKALLLGNHGLLTAGDTIEAVTAWFILLDKCCQIQLLADASSAGSGIPLVKLGEEEAQSTWEALGHASGGYCEFIFSSILLRQFACTDDRQSWVSLNFRSRRQSSGKKQFSVVGWNR